MKSNNKDSLVSVIVVTKDRKVDFIKCLISILKSEYKNIETVVVDNSVNENIAPIIKKRFPQVKYIKNKINVGAAEGRNIGIDNSNGEFLLFMDDDAEMKTDMITKLMYAFEKKSNAGIVQPIVLDKSNKSMLQGAGHAINLLTGRIVAWGVQEKNDGQYDMIREIPLAGCVWMVKREVVNRIGGYDTDYFIPYEDSDFSQRARDAGFKIYCYGQAKSYHTGVKTTFVNKYVEWLGITSKERAFRIMRNKLLYVYKNAPPIYFLVFLLIFFPLYLVFHSLVIIYSMRFDILVRYYQGVLSGVRYIVFNAIKKYKTYD